jgi:hypothetical protein
MLRFVVSNGSAPTDARRSLIGLLEALIIGG